MFLKPIASRPPQLNLAPADKRNRLSFRSLQISHEGVLVLREVGVRTGDFPVHETFFDFANVKTNFFFSNTLSASFLNVSISRIVSVCLIPAPRAIASRS